MNIAIITGASSGMGKEYVQQISAIYTLDEIWVIARRIDRLESLSNLVSIKVVPISLDLIDQSSFDTYKTKLENEKPNVKILVNCSGFGVFRKFEDISYKDNIDMIDLNIKALVSITFFTLPYMFENSKIINLGSMSSFMPLPHISIYAASKSFVLSFSRSLNRELKSKKIKVLCVCPYWVKTEFFNRANTDNHITKFDYIYTPQYVVSKSLKALNKKNKDYIVPGKYAKFLQILCKIFPHSFVMSTFLRKTKFNDAKNK